MGWTNYVKIPDWKLIIEISRHTAEAYELEDTGYLNMPDVNKQVRELTLSDINDFVEYVNKVPLLEGDEFLLQWLQFKGVQYDTITESNIDLNEETKNGYKIIRLT